MTYTYRKTPTYEYYTYDILQQTDVVTREMSCRLGLGRAYKRHAQPFRFFTILQHIFLNI